MPPPWACLRRPSVAASLAVGPSSVATAQIQTAARYFSAAIRARGAAYAQAGRVGITEASRRRVEAVVEGTQLYDVTLAVTGTCVRSSCTCPFADGGDPCKHLWATILFAEECELLDAFPRTFELLFEQGESDEKDDDHDDDDDEDTGANDNALERTAARAAPERAPLQALPDRAPTRSAHRETADAPARNWRAIVRAGGDVAPRAPRERAEIRYGIDVAQSRAHGCLSVVLFERTQRKGGLPWRRTSLVHDRLREAFGVEDLPLVALLEALGPTYGWRTSGSPARFDVDAEAASDLLARLCATGRARLLRAGDDDIEGPPLVWDEGAPYELVLALQAIDGARARDRDLALVATLEREGERVTLDAPSLLLPGGSGGLVFFGDRVARLDDAGQFGWIAALRAGPVRVPVDDVVDLVIALHATPRAPRLVLPPEHALTEVRVVPKPYALFTMAKRTSTDGASVDAGFDYDGVRVSLGAASASRAAVDRAGRRLLVRDPEAESAARELLATHGVRTAAYYSSYAPPGGAPFHVASSRVFGAMRALVEAGWRVEMDGRAQRRAGKLALGITSGVDWFDVGVKADFDGVDVPLPALLAALREKRTTVVLSDGSLGVLPEAWALRLKAWAALGDAGAERGALRFGRAQVALLSALAEREPDIACDDAFIAWRAKIASFDGVRSPAPPKTFRGELRPYQRKALGWFAFLRDFGFGGCLADDMGLGKTVQVLALLEARRVERARERARASKRGVPHAPRASLIVVPRSLLHNWQTEAARFTPRLRFHVHDGVGRAPAGAHLHEHDVVLTTYGILRRDAGDLAKVDFDYAVIDEAQAIKTPTSGSAKAARMLSAAHRLALSGTPIENHLGELASLFEFLNPGVLGASRALESLASGARTIDLPTRDLVARAIRPFFLRRTKSEVAPELPDRVEQTLECHLERDQQRLYDQLRTHYRASLMGRVAKHGMGRSTVHVLEALLRLRQAACHPGLIDPARRGDPSAKLDALLAQLGELRAEGQKALVFSQFTSLLSIVRDRLDAAGVTYEYLDGATRDRAARVDRFQSDPACSVFLLSLKAGGVGLNLTAAEYVFLLDPWWNPAVEAQAIDRAHRIGQSRKVFAYRLLAKGTVEEKVAELQKTKRELAQAIFGDGGNGSVSGMTRDDLELLLS
jgi:superfamily II DNA or RNA helicase